MTDLAPDGRARLAGKKGTDIGKVRGEGAIFLRETICRSGRFFPRLILARYCADKFKIKIKFYKNKILILH